MATATAAAAKPAAAPAKVIPPGYAPFVCAAAAASWAEICTIPLDTAKVRLQIQGNAPAGTAPKYTGMLNTFTTIAKEEGPRALWKGYGPHAHLATLPLDPLLTISVFCDVVIGGG